MGTVESCVRSPWIPVGTRIESHRISQLSHDWESDPFLDILGDPKGLRNSDDTAAGLLDGEASAGLPVFCPSILLEFFNFFTK